jgi:sugar phosphate isomerase/epimerase
MKIFADLSLAEALARAKNLGVNEVEIHCGQPGGHSHCHAPDLLNDAKKLKEFRSAFEESGIDVAALACHTNPVHPDKKIAVQHDEALDAAILLAEELGISKVVTYSGCPGSRTSKYPTWIVSVWPLDNLQLADYQWNEVMLPYWSAKAIFAKSHKVRIAIEMAGGYTIHNPRTLLRLREVCGETIGAAFDPAALIWQGVDCPRAIEALGEAILHFHARDCHINKREMRRNGFFSPDTSSGDKEHPYEYRIAGSGQRREYWIDMMYALQRSGYQGAISVRHEDMSLDRDEGLSKTMHFLSDIIPGKATDIRRFI